MKSPEKLLPQLSLTFLVALGAFGCGVGVGKYELWPLDLLLRMKQAVTSYAQTGRIYPAGLIVRRAENAADARLAITVENPLGGGQLAIMGYDTAAGQYAIWLFGGDGIEQHRWPLNYSLIDADGPSGGNDQPHGLVVLEDGSIVVNFDHGDAVARFDSCGEPQWITPGIFHHVMDRAEDGSIWSWVAVGGAYTRDQRLVNLDTASGAVRNTRLLADIARQSDAAGLAFSVPRVFDFSFDPNADRVDTDLFHPNDIEILRERDAAAFPLFEAGDQLISLRNLNLVAVLDGETQAVKWAQRGPWRRQHDPDFLHDGTISVYNNNSGTKTSSIVTIDPVSMETRELFLDSGLHFYSESMGVHETLDDGTVVLVVPEEGRVIVVDENGTKRFEFNNIVAEEFNAHVQNAVWIPPGYFATQPACPAAR